MSNMLYALFVCLWLPACPNSGVDPVKEIIVEQDSVGTEVCEEVTLKLVIDSDTVNDSLAQDPQDPIETSTTIQHGERRLRLIFDTDIAEDCDDVGAMAVLHALADRDELDILGMMVSMPVDYGAPALDAINTYFNRPDIPIGTLKNSHDSVGAANLEVYNKALATQFPNDLKHANNTPNALGLYRKLLAKEPDNSVVILTVGPLTNLYHLMQSTADEYSPLSGVELIQKKVKRFIMAGGKLPEGTSYNFRISPDKSEYVINNWPTEHWLVPNELGDSVFTGNELLSRTTVKNPIHMAYKLYKAAHPGWEFRPSWDQMGVYIAARHNDPLFKKNTTGSVKAHRHFISWHPVPDKAHTWFQSNSTREKRRTAIEALMIHAPE